MAAHVELVRQQNNEIKRLAEDRRHLVERLDVAELDLKSTGPVKVADPGAAALASYLSAIGLRVGQDRMADLFTLITVLALEVGSALAGVLVRSVGGPVQRSTLVTDHRSLNEETGSTLNATADHVQARSAVPSATKAEPQGTSDVQGVQSAFNHVQSVPTTLVVAAGASERLLNMLAERGGSAFGSQATFARALGVSTGTVHATLHSLRDLGRVTVEASRRGTKVALVTAH